MDNNESNLHIYKNRNSQGVNFLKSNPNRLTNLLLKSVQKPSNHALEAALSSLSSFSSWLIILISIEECSAVRSLAVCLKYVGTKPALFQNLSNSLVMPKDTPEKQKLITEKKSQKDFFSIYYLSNQASLVSFHWVSATRVAYFVLVWQLPPIVKPKIFIPAFTFELCLKNLGFNYYSHLHLEFPWPHDWARQIHPNKVFSSRNIWKNNFNSGKNVWLEISYTNLWSSSIAFEP